MNIKEKTFLKMLCQILLEGILYSFLIVFGFTLALPGVLFSFEQMILVNIIVVLLVLDKIIDLFMFIFDIKELFERYGG